MPILSYRPFREVYSPWHLRRIMAQRNIDVSTWFKPVEQLYRDLQNREIELVLLKDQLVLRVESVRVVVYSPDGTLVLEDDYRIRKSDGAKRSKTMLRRSVSEKMYLDYREGPEQAAYRAIAEELYGGQSVAKIVESYILRSTSVDILLGPDKDYAGLNFLTTDHVFETTIPACTFDPRGYAEVQRDKTVYFNWFPV